MADESCVKVKSGIKKYLRVGRIVLSAAIIGFLLRKIHLPDLVGQFSEVNWMIIVSVYVILFLQYALASLRWKIVLTGDGRFVPFHYLLKTYLIGNLIGLFLPSGFGGDLYRVYALGKYEKDYVKNTSSVLFDRLVGLFSLISLALISMCLFQRGFLRYSLVSLYFGGVFLFWAGSSDRGISLLRGLEKTFANVVVRIAESFGKYRKNLHVLAFTLCLGLLFQIMVVFVNKMYCYALGINISLGYLFAVIPLIYLTEALPISINGIGVREGAFVFFFVQAGYTKEEALAVGLLVISMRYIFSITVGGGLLLRESRGVGESGAIIRGLRRYRPSIRAEGHRKRTPQIFARVLSRSSHPAEPTPGVTDA